MALLISGTEGAWYQVFETGVFDIVLERESSSK